MRVLCFFLASPIILASHGAMADTSDPVAARAQLQQGYALKQEGKCEQAVPHLKESVRLDRQTKALLNLADCEEKLGRLGAAQTHFVEARDLARAQGLEPEKGLAEQRLQAVEKRMPKLTVRLAKDAPRETVVTRDGAELGNVSLGTPLPIDPGTHTVIARGAGLQHRYMVTLSEAQTNELEVTPIGGEALGSDKQSGQQDTAIKGNSEPAKDESSATATGTSSSRVAAVILGGVGLVGIAVGSVAGLNAIAKNNAADESCAPDHCTSEQYPNFRSLRDDAVQARTLSIVGFGAGGIAIVSAAVLLLTDSRSTAARQGLRLEPQVASGGAAAVVRGEW